MLMLSTNYFIESNDNSKLCFRHWRVSEPKICICLVHGLSEHSARYENWAALFNKNNIAVCAIDLRGHGLSEGKRGHAKSFEKLFDDVDRLLIEAEAHYLNVPKILYGHSLGGNIVLNYYLSRKPNIAGLIVTSPWFKLTHTPGTLTILFAQLMKYLHPSFTSSNQLNPEHISRNNIKVEEYKTDELVHNRISVKLYFEAVNHGKRVSGRGYMINVPMLLMHGTADNITSYKASTNFSRNTGVFTTFKSWDDAFHELHNEINYLEVFDFTLKWIKQNFDK